MSSSPTSKDFNVAKKIHGEIHGNEFYHIIERLYQCWREIGYDSATLHAMENAAASAVIDSAMDNLRNCLHAEEQQFQEYRKSVEECTARVAQITGELSLPPYEVDENLPLIEKSRILREKAESLEGKRKERMQVLKKMIRTNRELCGLIGHPVHNIDPVVVPSQERLNAFGSINAELRQEKDRRFAKMQDLKREITQLMVEFERGPSDHIERHLFGETPESEFPLTDGSLRDLAKHKDDLFAAKLHLTEEIMQLRDKCRIIRSRLGMDDATETRDFEEQVKAIRPSSRDLLNEELARLEELKRQNMQRFIEELRTEIQTLHSKCFYGHEEKQPFFSIPSHVFDEETLGLYEAECERLRLYYNQNMDFFSKVVKREEMWKKKMEADKKENDPDRFKNRGGQLLRDQQEKLKVEHELKKLDAELSAKIAQWEKEKGAPFAVYGIEYSAFLRDQKETYAAQLEAEKEDRKRAKEHGTDGAPATKRKLDEGPKKDSATAKMQRGHLANNGGTNFLVRSPKVNRVGPTHDV